MRQRRTRRLVLALPLAVALLAGACSASAATPQPAGGGAVVAVGAENEYANVISQVGGKYVRVSAVMSNPNSDPHTFEASPSIAQQISGAQLVVQNGLGYDTFMNTVENAAPDPARKVIDVQQLLHLPDGTPNPHLWYKPGTMTAVARAVATDLAALDPAHAAYFRARAGRFAASLGAWTRALASFRSAHPHTPVAVTEPVADYMLAAAGADILTPWPLQADIMNGVDPSPQAVALERSLLTQHRVKALIYNHQVTDPLTQSLIASAHANGIPVLGVYETMPTPGYDYQTWMLAEVRGLQRAVTARVSTERL